VQRFRVWSSLWADFPEQAQQLARGAGVTRVCELGGGANPIIPLELIAEHGLEHEVADISAEELAKAPEGYRTVLADATSPDFRARGPFDLIVTAFLAEHVPDPDAFHAVVRAALRPGGLAFHVFPTLYEPTFFANLLLPERVTEPLLMRIQRGREPEGAHAKFRAYYRWCRGPTRLQIRRFERAGFEVVEYVGYFGHGYFDRLPFLDRIEQALSRTLARHPIPALTSYATVVLRRPHE
jgi:SAM-dependent methyltransferase